MNFGFTEEQDLLRAEVRKFLDANAPLETVRKLMATERGYSPKLWSEMAELGWLGLLIPEIHGGAELSWVDLTVLLEECGRSLFPSPLLATTLAAIAINEHGSAEQRERWLPGLANGSRVASIALQESADGFGPEGITTRATRSGDGITLTGEKRFVPDAAAADQFIVSFRFGKAPEDVALAVVPADAAGVSVSEIPSLDATKRFGRLQLDDVTLDASCVLGDGRATGWPAVARLLDQAAAAVTAEAIGAAEAGHRLIVEYAKQRKQFGSLIGRYQGVKHPLAEMYVDIESCKSLLYYAAWCIDESPQEAPIQVSMAKAYLSDAFTRIGIDGIELHGALGYTWEYDAQLFLKRSKWVKAAFGGSDHHYDRVADLGGL